MEGGLSLVYIGCIFIEISSNDSLVLRMDFAIERSGQSQAQHRGIFVARRYMAPQLQ